MQKLPPAQHILTTQALQTLVQDLAHQPIVAVDTESNSLYAYQGKVCLIQLSTPTQDYIVDPIAIADMSALGEIFGNDHIEKVFHAAEYDIVCLKRDYGFTIRNIFDTMYAARMVNGQIVGLADLLSTYFGIAPDKTHQLDNWGERPLREASLRYAQMDTHYLIRLRNTFYEALASNDHLDEMREIFADIALTESKEQSYDPDGFWKLVKPHELSKRQLAVLAEVYQIRDELAQEDNVPPYKLIDNRTIIEIAVSMPTNFRELAQITSIRPELVRIYGEDLLNAIERGQKNKPPKQPPKNNVPQPISDRYVALHAWRKDKAIERKIESHMVLSKQTLWQIAHAKPTTLEELATIGGVGEWRIAHYGDEIIDVMKRFKK